MIIFYDLGYISKVPDFDGFSFLICNVNVDLIVNVKMATLSAQFVLKDA